MGDGRTDAKLIMGRLSLHLLFVFFLFTAIGCEDRHRALWVDDRAGLLQREQVERLNHYHAVLFDQLDVHFKVIILDKPAEDIDKTAVDEFGTLGKKTSAARGLLFLVDPVLQQVRIEVGYDLEHILPDGFIGNIEELQMKPFFAQGAIGQGIEATGELLVQKLLDEEPLQNQHDQQQSDQQYYSGGAGAKIDTGAEPGQYDKKPVAGPALYSGAVTPEDALNLYKQVLANRIKDPELALYTPETRKFFSKWVVTDAQQMNELKSLQQHVPVKIRIQNDLAVIRYAVIDRTVPPYFLQYGEDGWMFDFATMSRVIQMNHRNQWRMKSTDHPYMFGFDDLLFDGNGFPFPPSGK